MSTPTPTSFVTLGRFFLSLLTLVSGALPVSATEFKPADTWARREGRPWTQEREASFSLRFDQGLHCSAVRIGPRGEALTNLHCLEGCLEAASLVVNKKLPVQTQIELHELKPLPSGLTCGAEIGLPGRPVKVEILWAGGGKWLSPRTELEAFRQKEPQALIALHQDGIEGAGDLALIRVLGEDTKSCAPLALAFAPLSALAENESFVNFSFPIFMRRDTSNPFSGTSLWSMGHKMMASRGSMTSDKSHLARVNPATAEQGVLDFMLAPGLLIGSFDTEPGSSGSPVFNEQGEVVALIRATWKGDVGAYLPWTSQAVDLHPWRETLHKWVPDNESCRSLQP